MSAPIDYHDAYRRSVEAHLVCDREREELRRQVRDLEERNTQEQLAREQARAERDEARRETRRLWTERDAYLAEKAHLRDTLERVAVSFIALHPQDSGKNDDVGEVYYLLRECGAIEEDGK